MASARLIRLASVKTAARHASSGVQSSSEDASRSLLEGIGRSKSFSDQERFSTPSSHHLGNDQNAASSNVTIQVFAHGALGKEAILVAFLSNSILLVMRIGAEGLHSWLLDWPVAGRIRGLCVSPDLQCALCVTEGLGVYLLAINTLGEQGEAHSHSTESVPNLDERNKSNLTDDALRENGSSSLGSAATAAPGPARAPTGIDSESTRSDSGKRRSSLPATGAASTARHARKRAVADTAFPSLAHLASRGEQRKRAAGGEKPRHPCAEPVFIASLARRGERGGAGDESDQPEESDDDARGGSRRHSTGLGGRGQRRRRGTRNASAPFQCLWWVTQNGDHFAVIGGLSGEVHFLDLERLDAWVVTQPPPVMARGRVCALSIVMDLLSPVQRPPPPAGSDAAPPLASEPPDCAASPDGKDQSSHYSSRHLVSVLETGAVFVVLLEHSITSGFEGSGVAGSIDKVEEGTESEALEETDKQKSHGHDGGNSPGVGVGSNQLQQPTVEYVRLRADLVNHSEFAPLWLDVGRGGGGGGGGGMGVRAMPLLDPARSVAGNASSRRFRMSIVSRAWGNKCAVKILRLAGISLAARGISTRDKGKDHHQQQGWGRDKGGGGGGKQQPLRTETLRQITLPVDHSVPEDHALAMVDESYAVLASPPAGGAPARVTVAPLGGAERPAPHTVCVFPLPPGERVSGVALVPCEGDVRHNSRTDREVSLPENILEVDRKASGLASTSGLWGLVWSDSCVYRIDLGLETQAAVPPKPADVDQTADPPQPQPQPQTTPPKHSRPTGTAGSIALHRPSAAAVRRARELHANGQLPEAVKAAISALDGSKSSSTAGSRGAGGGVTTRMVREGLANSLLEWLVKLHVKQTSHGSSADALLDAPRGGDISGSGGSRTAYDGGMSTARNVSGVLHGRSAAERGDFHPSSKNGAVNHESADPAGVKMSSRTLGDIPAALEATSLSQLERYLLTSRDYDPVLAATLLHENGEDDLAVVAGSARGVAGEEEETVLSKVLRVLTECEMPPILGPRAVAAVCSDQMGAPAVRELIQAGGGTLFAALEPCLQLKLLLSDRSIMFGGAGGRDPLLRDDQKQAAAAGAAAVGEPSAIVARSVEDGAVAGVLRHASPIVSSLSAEELSRLISTLARWCNDDATFFLPDVVPAAAATGHNAGEATESASATVDVCHHDDDDNISSPNLLSSAAAIEAVEVLVQALCELSGRKPPPGESHKRAWLHAGCIIGDSDVAAGLERQGEPPPPTSLSPSPSPPPPPPPLRFEKVTASLCSIFAVDGVSVLSRGEGEGKGHGDRDGEAGGLPTLARRRLLRVLPIVRGWHDQVGALLRAKEAGCWASVALLLELSGNRREAASAKLHGAVAFLQGGEDIAPGETARILSGTCHSSSPQGLGVGPSESSGSATGSITAADSNKLLAGEAILRTVNKHAFPGVGWRGDETTATNDVNSEPTSAAAFSPPLSGSSRRNLKALPSASSTTILERASVLAEALCVWKYFGLSLAFLEAFLRPRLGNAEAVRVLTAVFFPQLSRDGSLCEPAPISGPTGSAVRRDAGRRGRRGKSLLKNETYLHDFGLSPRFFLTLTRAAVAKLSGLASSTAAPTPTSRLSSSYRPSRVLSDGIYGSTSDLSPLTLLVENRGGDRELTSRSVQLAEPSVAAPPAAAASSNAWGNGPDAWPPSAVAPRSAGVGGYPSRSSTRTSSTAVTAVAAATGRHVEDNIVWFFSCGHQFSREHLLNTVVPESASSVRQATASLERTQHVLALEYAGRRDLAAGATTTAAAAVGAACPDCAAKELVRLAGVAGASMQTRPMSAEAGNAMTTPPLSLPSQRLQTQQGRPRVR